MAGKQKYPLEQVLSVKKDRVEKAERVVDEKKRLLAIEEEKLQRVEAECNQIRQHRNDKIQQIKQAFDTGTTSDEVLQKKAYLKIVEEKLVKAEQKVSAQKQLVHKAQEALTAAQEELRQRRLEEEKLNLHKEEWEKQMKQELARQEAKDHDEIGQLMHESRKRKQEH